MTDEEEEGTRDGRVSSLFRKASLHPQPEMILGSALLLEI